MVTKLPICPLDEYPATIEKDGRTEEWRNPRGAGKNAALCTRKLAGACVPKRGWEWSGLVIARISAGTLPRCGQRACRGRSVPHGAPERGRPVAQDAPGNPVPMPQDLRQAHAPCGSRAYRVYVPCWSTPVRQRRCFYSNAIRTQ